MKFAILPTSFKPISSYTIQLVPEQPRYNGSPFDVFHGLYDGSRVAVKILRVNSSLDDDQKVMFSDSGVSCCGSCESQRFRNEVVHSRYLRHPNIVPFVGVCDKSPLCFVSHWMEEGTLLEYFKRHPGERRTSYVGMNTTPLCVFEAN
jgi:serine/threonine protein kinase